MPNRHVHRTSGTTALTLLLGLAGASAAQAQSSGGLQLRPPGGGARAEMQKKMTELKQIRSKLDTIRDEALENPALEKKQAALESKLEAAMAKKDPEAPKKRKAFEKLSDEFETAQKSGDQQKLAELAPKLQKLGQSLQATQRAVMKQEPIAEAVSSFQEAMLKQMNEVDPQTDQLMSRAQTLAGELQSAMGQRGPAPAPSGP